MAKRNKAKVIRFADDEWEHLNNEAKKAGVSKEEFVRCAVAGVTLRPKPPNEIAALLRELQAIGNNINQMARLANSRKYIAAGELAQIEKLLDDMWIKVKEL